MIGYPRKEVIVTAIAVSVIYMTLTAIALGGLTYYQVKNAPDAYPVFEWDDEKQCTAVVTYPWVGEHVWPFKRNSFCLPGESK